VCKVVSEEDNTIKSKKLINKSSVTPKRLKCEPNLILPTISTKPTTINLKRQGIPLDTLAKDEVLGEYFEKSRRLLKQINKYKKRKYRELYKKLLEDDRS
jgi:hypothetical protein